MFKRTISSSDGSGLSSETIPLTSVARTVPSLSTTEQTFHEPTLRVVPSRRLRAVVCSTRGLAKPREGLRGGGDEESVGIVTIRPSLLSVNTPPQALLAWTAGDTPGRPQRREQARTEARNKSPEKYNRPPPEQRRKTHTHTHTHTHPHTYTHTLNLERPLP